MTRAMSISYDEESPVTVVVTRNIRPGMERAYEDWLHGVASVSTKFRGHLGINIIRPKPGSREYTVVFRFDRPSNLRTWVESKERAEWLGKLEGIADGEAKIQELTGLEAWFTIPDAPGVRPPPRWKMAIITWLAICPLIMIVNAFVAPLVAPIPFPFRTLLVSAMMVVVMTWAIMPWFTKLFSRWLFPRAR
jgi:uncharacterized protein